MKNNFKKTKLICAVLALLMGILPILTTTQSVSAAEIDSIDPIEAAVGESLFYTEATNSFFIDEEIAHEQGLTEEHIANLREFVEYINSSPERVEQSLEYAGYEADAEPEISLFVLPLVVVAALKILGTGALAAVGGAIAKYGMSGACKVLKGKYKPFTNFCKSNGWASVTPDNSVYAIA